MYIKMDTYKDLHGNRHGLTLIGNMIIVIGTDKDMQHEHEREIEQQNKPGDVLKGLSHQFQAG
jgi:hypothetical protein